MFYCCLVYQSCLTLCDPIYCNTPGFPVFHYLLGYAQTHVHWVDYAIQQSNPVAPFSSCLQSFPSSGSFPVSQLFSSDGQSIGTSASASVFTKNIQSWFPSGLTGLISCCPRDSQESSSPPQFENINSSVLNLLYGPTLKLFNVLSKFIVAVLPRSKHLLISCGQFLKSYWICCNIASVLCFGFLALRHMESFFPWMEPTPPALEVEVLTTEPPGKSLDIIYFNMLNPPQGACYLLTQMVSLLWLYNSYLHFLLWQN